VSSVVDIAVVFGTRPEAVKLAPVVDLLQAREDVDLTLVATGQHRKMAERVLPDIGLQPDVVLHVRKADGSLNELAADVLLELGRLLAASSLDLVLVQGDTTSAAAAALAAFNAGIPVGHVEAGLRTYDRAMPFPEELNRQLIGRLATLHFAPTPGNRENLLSEHVPLEAITVTGNTVVDALLCTESKPTAYLDERLEAVDASERRVVLVTAHRRESWGVPMNEIAAALDEVAKRRNDVTLVFPIHRNPVLRHAMSTSARENVLLVEPVSPSEFVRLMKRSHFVLTDSGGIQEEAPTLGKPVLVMRDVTERPEALAAGTARLVGRTRETIVAAVLELLDDDELHARMREAPNPFGDGRAAERIVASILHWLGRGAPQEEFAPPAAAVV
jgi:UDP-N-acetylglucosamine 2-epimerase (non-hydrolysing)